jgi:hypothetical protein
MNKLAMKKTPGELARCYEQVSAKIDKAYGLLLEAREEYKAVYDEKFDPISRNDSLVEYARDGVKIDLKNRSWRRIIDLMQVQKLASSERWKEIEGKLYSKKDVMPEITEQEIINMYQSFAQNAGQIFAEAVKEVWDYLRPGKSRYDQYKTNDPNEIGEKVILVRNLEHLYNGKLTVNYYYRQELSNIDKVFHALDGNTAEFLQNGYKSILVDAINNSPVLGETKYFSWRGYKNGNLHLTIKRMDLVAEMARILREYSLASKNVV